MANTTQYRAPKRRIEKVWNRIQSLITNAVVDKVLHTAEDQKTLVRMRVQGNILNQAAACTYSWRIVKAVASTIPGNPSVAEALDQNDNKLVLLRGTGSFNANSIDHHRLDIDSKAMRKIQEDDEITLQFISDVNPGAKFSGVITLWFKE